MYNTRPCCKIEIDDRISDSSTCVSAAFHSLLFDSALYLSLLSDCDVLFCFDEIEFDLILNWNQNS